MPNENNSPNITNISLRPSVRDNFADNKLGKGRKTVKTPKGQIFDQPGRKTK